MIFTAIIPFFTLTLAILVIGWYHLTYLPKKYTKRLLAEGAIVLPDSRNEFDDLHSIKKGIQANPNMKAFIIQYPGSPFLFVTDTELIKQVLTNHHYYSKLSKGFELNRIFNSKGLSVSEGDAWKLHRKVLSEAFQYDLFNDMIPTILEATDEIIGFTKKEKKTIQAPKDIELITSDVITRIFFGIRSRDVMINGLRACDEAGYLVAKRRKFSMSMIRFILGDWALNFNSEYRSLKERMRTFRKVFGKKINERMEEIKAEAPSAQKKRDFLHILLQQRIKYNNDPAQTLSDEEILDEFSVFFLAGKDTTSILVSMALYSFVTFPEWQDKILQEINEKVKDTNQINIDILNSMNNLTAFISEVLRFYPPAPSILPRVANRDHYVGDFFVKKGCAISTMFVANHFNPKYFDDPEKFDPSRWLKTESQTRNEGWKNNSFAYVPFSAGPRNCIGKHLALIEAKSILISILKNYQVELEEGFKLQVSNSGIGFGPKNSIPLILTPK